MNDMKTTPDVSGAVKAVFAQAPKTKPFFFQVAVNADRAVSLGVIKSAMSMDDVKVEAVNHRNSDFLVMTGKFSGFVGAEDDKFLKENDVVTSGIYSVEPIKTAVLDTHKLFGGKPQPQCIPKTV